jgi:hypothetical protein
VSKSLQSKAFILKVEFFTVLGVLVEVIFNLVLNNDL